MKSELEAHDIQQIVSAVIEGLKPYFKANAIEDRIMDIKGFSAYAGVNVSWVYKNIYTLPHFRLGKYIRFRQSQVDKWINRNRIEGFGILK
jgi:predicted DNA-binding transcriptional regulator AlpA